MGEVRVVRTIHTLYTFDKTVALSVLQVLLMISSKVFEDTLEALEMALIVSCKRCCSSQQLYQATNTVIIIPTCLLLLAALLHPCIEFQNLPKKCQ